MSKYSTKSCNVYYLPEWHLGGPLVADNLYNDVHYRHQERESWTSPVGDELHNNIIQTIAWRLRPMTIVD